MLEQEIAKLTAAILTLNETLKANAAPFTAPASAAAPTEVEKPKLRGQQANRKRLVADDAQESSEGAADAAAAIEVQPEPLKPLTPVEVVTDQKSVTIEDLRAVGGKLVAAGRGTELKAVLATFGVEKLSALPTDKYAEAHAKLSEKITPSAAS